MTPPSPLRRRIVWPLRVIHARPRLFICLVLGAVIGIVLPPALRPVTRALLGWNAALLLYFAAVLALVLSSDADSDALARRAATQDAGNLTILFLTVVAAAAALGAIFYQLLFVRNVHGAQRAFHLLLAGVTVTSAWAFIHVMFALHYASECYSARARAATPEAKSRAGLAFPGDAPPDYLDFFYFSFVIGVACATADVNITGRRIRRTALVHSVVAFFFNSAVLALMINIAAGLA